MLVVGDLDDVFLPKPADLLVSLTEARACLENLLSRLADMFKDNHNVGNAMSSALQAAYKLIVRAISAIWTMSIADHCFHSHLSVVRLLYFQHPCLP